MTPEMEFRHAMRDFRSRTCKDDVPTRRKAINM